MIGRRAGGWLVSVIALVGLVWAGVAAGAAPTIERITVNESSEDEFLTEECGVPVTVTAQGHVIVRTFSGEGTGVAQVNTISIGLTATAGDRTFRFRDVGADVVQIKPDGTLVLLITGQVPFAVCGSAQDQPRNRGGHSRATRPQRGTARKGVHSVDRRLVLPEGSLR